MKHSRSKRTGLSLSLVLILSLFSNLFVSQVSAADQAFANSAFQGLWNRTDKLVADGKTSRSFLWGPSPNTGAVQEDYAEAPGGKRLVQYFDKSRMEITNPDGDKSSPYYVTNGLIAKELMTGQLQLGDSKFETRTPAEIGVAGDPDDTSGPTYKALERADKPAANNDTGILVAGFIDHDGNISFDKGDYGNKWKVSYQYFEPSTQHNIAGPFWTYLNQTGPILNPAGQQITGRIFEPVFFATGLPITEAYWAQVKVGGQVKDVLIQAFERRILTFTPTNDPAYQVEMGNVGQHYYKWRYGNTPPPGPASPPQVPENGCLPKAIVDEGLTVAQACVDKPNPAQRSDVTVSGRLYIDAKPASGANMLTVWHYKSKDSTCEEIVKADGIAKCTLNIATATSGFTVKIDVQFTFEGKTYTTSTSFTPQ